MHCKLWTPNCTANSMIDDYLQMNAQTDLNLKNRKVNCHSVSPHAFVYLTDQTPVIALSADVNACGSSGLTNEFTAALAASLNAWVNLFISSSLSGCCWGKWHLNDERMNCTRSAPPTFFNACPVTPMFVNSNIATKTVPSPSPATIHREWSRNQPNSLSMFRSSSWIASFDATQTSPLSSTVWTRSWRSIVKRLYSGSASVNPVTSTWCTFMLGHCTCGRSCNWYAWSCPVFLNSELNSDHAATTAWFTWNWSDRSPVVLVHSISVDQIVCFPMFSTQLHIEYRRSTAYATLKTLSSCSEHFAVQGSSASAINSHRSVNKTTGCGGCLSFTVNLHCSYTWPRSSSL